MSFYKSKTQGRSPRFAVIVFGFIAFVLAPMGSNRLRAEILPCVGFGLEGERPSPRLSPLTVAALHDIALIYQSHELTMFLEQLGNPNSLEASLGQLYLLKDYTGTSTAHTILKQATAHWMAQKSRGVVYLRFRPVLGESRAWPSGAELYLPPEKGPQEKYQATASAEFDQGFERFAEGISNLPKSTVIVLDFEWNAARLNSISQLAERARQNNWTILTLKDMSVADPLNAKQAREFMDLFFGNRVVNLAPKPQHG